MQIHCHTPLRELLTKELPLKDRRKRKRHYPTTWQHYNRASAQILTPRMDAGGVTHTRTQTRTEILLFLNLEFFVCLSVYLFVWSVSCLFVFVCSSLHIDFFGFFCFVLFFLLALLL
jgi:hypothetical protein